MDRDLFKQEIYRDEGKISYAYQDSLGYLTIGVGRLIDRRKGGGLSNDEIDYLLENDIDRVYTDVRNNIPWFDDLTDARQRALCNMCFQLGIGGLLKFKITLGLMRAGKFDEAAQNALKSKWAAQTPQRAKRIAKMIQEG